jgi:ubiquitin-conjugating enzyme E2 Z
MSLACFIFLSVFRTTTRNLKFEFAVWFDILSFSWGPPLVILRTTDNGQVRFNPNLYADGKVCLSILGTWNGPGWTPVQTLGSVLLSVLSLMNSAPYHNEPGYSGAEHTPGDSAAYNLIIRHETMRVAVVGILEHPSWPISMDSKFLVAAKTAFLANHDKIQDVCRQYDGFNGKAMIDPFGEEREKFNFEDISKRARLLKSKMEDGSWLQERTDSL